MNLILDDIWTNGYTWSATTSAGVKNYEFNVDKNMLSHPAFIDYNRFNIDTKLSGRALSSLVTQLAGIIGSSVEKQRKRLFMLDKLKAQGKEPSFSFLRKIKQNIPVKPNVNNVNMELSSNCCDWKNSDGFFNGYLRLKSIGSEYGKIKLPIQFHKLNEKYQTWNIKTSFLIGLNFINIRWEKDTPKLKTSGKTVGADQGVKTCLTLSDNQLTTKDIHGHDLDSILDKLARKRKGSKAFKQASEHRKNYINWSINQLDFSNIKELRLEEVIDIGYRNPTNKKLSHWTNTEIRGKVEDCCEQNGVRFVLQDSTYRSQRCCECGLVRKANRKGKDYTCQCGNVIDADLNAAKNHEGNLTPIPFSIRKLGLNKIGFYWLETGLVDLDGVEIGVPLDPTITNSHI